MQMVLCALKFKSSESLGKFFSNSEMFLKERNICKTVLHLCTNAWWSYVEKAGEVL